MSKQEPEKQAPVPSGSEIPEVVAPAKPQKISLHQIEAMKEHKRRGMENQAIAKIMGLSESVISRFTRDVRPERKPAPNNGEETARPLLATSLSKGDAPQLVVPRDHPLMFGPNMNHPELQLYFLMMAGDAVRLGYSSLLKYFEDTIGWLATLTEVRKLVGTDNPKEFVDQLKVLITKANQFDKMVANAQNIGEQMYGNRN